MLSMKKTRTKESVGGHQFHKDRHFNITINLVDSGEDFQVKDVHYDMKISELKEEAEFATGIPCHIQRLSYLDQGELLDKSDLRSNDFVPGAKLRLAVWYTWVKLMIAAAKNDIDGVEANGVTLDSKYTCPTLDYMQSKHKKAWFDERAFIALFIAAHRGHKKLVQRLIELGANVNAATKLGRTALHVAAARGHGDIIDKLLEHGADIDATDKKGQNAMTIAAHYGHKDCERHLFLFRWQQRAKETRHDTEHELFAHQYHDSTFPVWLKGKEGQVYFTKITPPGEYQGSAFSSPKRKIKKPKKPDLDVPFVEPPSVGTFYTDSDSSVSTIEPMEGKTVNATLSKFEVWLQNKRQQEQANLSVKKERQKEFMEKKKMMHEEKKLQKELQDKSYEKWLNERKDKSHSAEPYLKNNAQGGIKWPTLRNSKSPITGDDVWRNILRRRAREGDTDHMDIEYLPLRQNYKLFQKFKAETLPEIISKY